MNGPNLRISISQSGESMHLQQLGMPDATDLFNLIETDRDHLLPFDNDLLNVQSVGGAMRSLSSTRFDILRLGIWDDGQLRGETGLYHRAGAIAETYWWIGGEHVRNGYATRAQKMLGSWAFEAGRLTSLYATIHADNIASQAVAESAGFRLEEQQSDSMRYIKEKDSESQPQLVTSDRLE